MRTINLNEVSEALGYDLITSQSAEYRELGRRLKEIVHAAREVLEYIKISDARDYDFGGWKESVAKLAELVE